MYDDRGTSIAAEKQHQTSNQAKNTQGNRCIFCQGLQQVYNKPLITLKNRKARLGFAKKHLKEAAQLWKNSLDRWNQYGKIQTRRETAESKAYMCHAVIPKQSMRNFCEIPWCKVECLPFNCIIIVWFHVHCGDAQRQNYINHVFVQLSIQEGHRVIFCTFNHFCYL